MSRTRGARPQSSGFLAETQLILIGELHPNPWNVNRLNAFGYAKLLESIKEFGFIDPLIARPCPVHPDFEIVGGENRWNAGRDLAFEKLPVIVRQMTDQVARKISIIDNELHGQADPVALGDLLKGLHDDLGTEDLLTSLPYTPDILAGFLDFNPMPSLPAGPEASPLVPSPGESPAERWVERTYRMPAAVAEVVDQALARAREQLSSDAKDFQALEVVAAEYLAS